jgi:hypothetical protein
MVLTLPPFNSIINSNEKKTKKIYQNNVQYNPIYNNIYDLQPKIIKKTDKVEEGLKKNIFDLDLMTIIKNISDAILLVLIDLTDLNNYSRLSLFLNIFFKENRLIYLGIFIIILSFFCLLFQ